MLAEAAKAPVSCLFLNVPTVQTKDTRQESLTLHWGQAGSKFRVTLASGTRRPANGDVIATSNGIGARFTAR